MSEDQSNPAPAHSPAQLEQIRKTRRILIIVTVVLVLLPLLLLAFTYWL